MFPQPIAQEPGRDKISAQMRTIILNIPSLYQRNSIGIKLEQAESIGIKMLEKIAATESQLKTLRSNLEKQQTPQILTIQKNLIEMISTKFIELNNLVLTLKTTLENIKLFISLLINEMAHLLDLATQTTKRQAVIMIIQIQDRLINAKGELTTLSKNLNIIEQYADKLARNKNQNYAINIEQECRTDTIFGSLGIIKVGLENAFKSESLTRRLNQTRAETNTILNMV